MDDIVERLDYEIAEAMSVIEDQIDGDLTTDGRGLIVTELLRMQRSALLAAAVLSSGESSGETAASTPSSRFAERDGGVTFR
jgi:hypothetical protein